MKTLDTVKTISLPQECLVDPLSATSRIYRLVPSDAAQPWIMELYDIAERTTPHYHKIKTQTYMILEGRAKFLLGEAQEILEAGQHLTIPPGLPHTVEPEGLIRLLVIDWPNLPHPEDYYPNIEEAPSFPLSRVCPFEDLTKLPSSCYQQRKEGDGYVAYEICEDLHHTWSIAILDIKDAAPHFHKQETEHFIVLSGQLKITLDDVEQTLDTGQSISIKPGCTHHLRSAGDEAVRLLCASFPAFDPSDFYPL